MITTPTYQRFYAEFKTFIASKNYAGVSTTYTTPIKELLMWLEEKGIVAVTNIRTSVMVEYYEYLTTRPNKRLGGTLSSSTISGHLFSMALFFDYLLDTDQIKSAFVLPKFKKGKYDERQTLTEEEMQEVYSVCTTKLERALLSIAYGCGLRRKEIQHLNTVDIRLSKGILIVVNGKNNKRREVPMSEGVIRDLKDYFHNERGQLLQNVSQLERAFSINSIGKRMSGDTMNKRLKEIILRTNNEEIISKGITLHCLRHSIAQHLIERGASIEFVQSFLGHNDADTSYLYAVKQRKKNKVMAIIG